MKMSMEQTAAPRFIAKTVDEAVFAEMGPQPRILWEDQTLKVVVAGLRPGQQIPVHPEALAVYTFLEGAGTMTVGDEQFAVQEGVTVIVPQGAKRGMVAQSELVFIATRAAPR